MAYFVRFLIRLKEALRKNASHDISGADIKYKKAEMDASLTPRSILQQEITEILSKQFNDAKIKQKNSHHWGNIGSKVEQAALKCEGIITLKYKESLPDYFDRVLPELGVLAESYRRYTSDEDGYALGTVREVENALISCSKSIKKFKG
ncbi:hypothetical protein ACUM5Y_01625 [Marinomonas dokdonensis]|uniref:hypothetical protein n=1 Tax=Marinomonas dokdonensis TaxID=328224 RepID=UPI00405594E1